MKTWHYLVAAVALWAAWRWYSKRRDARDADRIRESTVGRINDIIMDDGSGARAWGGAHEQTELHAADQNLYPGWFRTSDGGWVKPDTGEYFSPGSSPAAYWDPYLLPPDDPRSYYYQHPEMIGYTVDIANPGVGVVGTPASGIIY